MCSACTIGKIRLSGEPDHRSVPSGPARIACELLSGLSLTSQLRADAINGGAALKSLGRSLEDVTGELPRLGMVDRSARHDHALVVLRLQNDDLLGIAQHGDIGIVRDYDDLASLLGAA